MKTNIILPSASGPSHDYRARQRDKVLEAMQSLESIRVNLGNPTFFTLTKNLDFLQEITECLGVIKSARPDGQLYRSGAKFPYKQAPQSPTTSYFNPHRRIDFDFDTPLPRKKETFAAERMSTAITCVKRHIEAAHYGPQNVEFSDTKTPSLVAKRYKRRWHTRQYTVDWTVTLPTKWVQSGAPDVAKAFDNKFVPLRCSAIQSLSEYRIYQVTRAIYKPVKDDVQITVDSGFAAFINRPGKDALAGWGDTSEAAIKGVKRAMAKEARERLLSSMKPTT
jgi:hypothetical protein